MILPDSSVWIEYAGNYPMATALEKYLLQTDSLIVPTVVFYEVYRQLIKKFSKESALAGITNMKLARVVALDEDVALFAAELSLEHKLAMADAIVYATGLLHGARLITLDNDFRNLPHCTVIE